MERSVIEMSLTQARSSEDSKDPYVGKAHERFSIFGIETNTENVSDSSQTRSVHESGTFNVGEKTLRERTGRPVVDHDNLSHEQTMVNEANMDFRIAGLPHSVVKHAQSTIVRELRKLRTTQIDKVFNKIHDKMNHSILFRRREISNCEFLETEPKTLCRACLTYWNLGIVHCTCGLFFFLRR